LIIEDDEPLLVGLTQKLSRKFNLLTANIGLESLAAAKDTEIIPMNIKPEDLVDLVSRFIAPDIEEF
jgi:hypothetical protein